MDVDRKRSQIAVVDAAGDEQRNPNLPNNPVKLVPILGVLPPGTPVASEAADGWGWLVELLEELGAGAAPGASQPLYGDCLGQAQERQGRCAHPGPAARGRPAPRGLDRPAGDL